MKRFITIAFFIVFFAKICQGDKHFRETEKSIIDSLLASNRYDSQIIPFSANDSSDEAKPVLVTVNYLLRSVESIDDRKGEWTVQLTFRQSWTDERLQFIKQFNHNRISYLSLPGNYEARIWKPDTFFKEARSGRHHQLLLSNHLIRVYPDGTVLYSTHITLTLSCPMGFRHYPFDRQTCQISFASCEYSCLASEFTWKRSTHPVLMHLPGFLFVLVCFTGFWLDGKKDITARTVIVFGSLLALALSAAYQNALFPVVVNYNKKLDIWNGASLALAFVALLEL
ncbi:Glycine receptor subunit alpha-3, partial [Tyrophagus putrescentiae]